MMMKTLQELRDEIAAFARSNSDPGSVFCRAIVADLDEMLDADMDPAEKARLIEEARALHGSDEIEVDSDARFSVSDDGTWVQGWLWVPAEEIEEDDE